MTTNVQDQLQIAIEQMDSLDQIEFLITLEGIRDGDLTEATWDVNGTYEESGITWEMLPDGDELLALIDRLNEGY